MTPEIAAMSPLVEMSLALILFFPWFAILGALFWLFPRWPRGARRRLFDLAALTFAAVLSVIGMRWGYLHADTASGAIWKQVLATLIAYKVFLAVMGLALWLRFRWFRAKDNSP